ncbi:hypothetical protein C8R44DRAFT_919020 [Mycena epipterygia]|nr:hypothetical protein C8R44DRAFT_919020 [Mycena epipterygia]
MHRRGNKSKKVPNVKLRPAHPGAMARARASPEPTSCWAEDSQIVGSDDTVMLGGSCPRPFKNVVVCATGVSDKPALFKLALELGATSVSAFTDRVTHLVAEAHGGAKYLCALERKIPILTPAWIIESHRIWQHGDDVDLVQSVAAHRLPVFSGVTLCISGITDIVRRTQINKALTAAGGTYVKALERPVRVTHLLCAGAEETDKMLYADKFNRAGEADPPIQLVWEEWFWDSLEFGGRFDEARYQARLPRPARRGGSTLNLFDTATEAPPRPNANASANPHLVPSAYDDDEDDNGEDELASIQRLPAVTLQLWGSLLKARGYEVARGGVMLSPKKAREMAEEGQRSAADAEPLEGAAGASANASVLSSFRRANSFVAPRASNSLVAPRANSYVAPRVTAQAFRDQPHSAGAGPSRVPFGRSASAVVHGSAGMGMPVAGPSSTRGAPGPSSARGAGAVSDGMVPADEPSTVFAGLRFLLRGEADTKTVRGAIEGAGGAVVGGSDADADYVIVRLVGGSALYLAESSLAMRTRYRTECWIERCLFVDRLCEPEAHASFVPLGVGLPVPGAAKIILSFSGLDASEACWVGRLLKALGITLATAFSRQTTHLLCPGGTGAKYARARQWGVPVVHMGWLAAMARGGAVPEVNAFLVLPAEEERHVAAEAAETRKSKGKEKMKAEDTMQDITNSYDSQESQPQQDEFVLPSFGDPGPALGFGQPDGSLGGKLTDPPPATPSPLKRRQSTTDSKARSRSRPTTPLPLVARAVPAPTPSSTRSCSSLHSSNNNNNVRRAATFGAPGSGRAREESTTRMLSSSSPVRIPAPSSSARVPSSASPSPLRRGASVSPAKIPDERTKALQDSIASLLGKRAAPAVAEDAPRKRGRAQRSKPQSRQVSDVLPVYHAPEGDLSGFGGGRTLSPGPDDGACEGLSLGADEQSLRVMYEDPGQRAELERLALMIGEPLEGSGAGGKKKPRRSARRSGTGF